MDVVLPLFFRPLGQGYLATNQLGSFAKLPSRADLEGLIHGRTSQIQGDLIEDLRSKGFVCDDSETSIRLNSISSALATRWNRAMSGPALVMIVPTLNCDHDCRYCQVSRAPLNKPGYSLGMEAIPQIIEMIESLPSKEIKVEFQGGEPLVRFEFIKEFVRQQRSTRKTITYVICSALGPLSPEILAWAKDHPVHFSVSLDGNEAIHAGNRPSEYFNSYRQTTEGIGQVVAALGGDAVSCLATITRQALDRPEAVVDAYYELGLSRIFLRPLSPFGFASKAGQSGGKLGYSVREFMTFYRAALERIVEHNEERPFIDDQALIHLQRIYQLHRAGYVDLQSPAGFMFGALVVNYDGRIFGSDEARMLWQSTRADELVLGTVGDSLAQLFASPAASGLLSRSFTACSPGCDECAYQPYCGADPMHHLGTQGDDVGDKSISFFCQFQRAIFDFVFEELCGQTKTAGVMQSWLRQ